MAHATRAIAGLLVLDMVWLRLVMRPRYEALVSAVQGGRPMRFRAPAAAGAYALMVVGLRAFVLDAPRPRAAAAARGALFGAVLYGVYNLTAMAVLRDWRARLAALDVAWGAAVYAAAGALG
jgi:uncharacterized membrane protein